MIIVLTDDMVDDATEAFVKEEYEGLALDYFPAEAIRKALVAGLERGGVHVSNFTSMLDCHSKE